MTFSPLPTPGRARDAAWADQRAALVTILTAAGHTHATASDDEYVTGFHVVSDPTEAQAQDPASTPDMRLIHMDSNTPGHRALTDDDRRAHTRRYAATAEAAGYTTRPSTQPGHLSTHMIVTPPTATPNP